MEMIYEINPKIRNSEVVVIYGAGTSGERLLAQLLYDNIKVDFFCDSNMDNWGKEVLNKKIISPDELYAMKDKAAVLISSVYCEEIYESLVKAGVEKIFLTHKDVFGQPKK